MKRFINLKEFMLYGYLLFSITGCRNLDEEALDGSIQSGGSAGAVNTAAFLQTAYNGLRDFQNQGTMFALDEMSGDDLVGPTRGGDWDDNGSWRQIHTHTWDPVHVEVRNSWNSLLSNVYNCNQVIYNNGTPTQILFSHAMHQRWSAGFEARIRHWAGLDRHTARGTLSAFLTRRPVRVPHCFGASHPRSHRVRDR